MRFMMLLRLDPATLPESGPDEKLMQEMGELITDMTKAGVLVDTGGLRPLDESVRIRQTGGTQTVVDGPFAEAKEFIGGYCMLDVADQAEAKSWASRFLAIHGPEWDIETEIRQVESPE
jgi:hypothetical protein